MSQYTLEQAYQYCQQMAKNHYENFPVASRLLPRQIRKPITVIYAFARNADDFADEGELDESTRLQLLDNYSLFLQALEQNIPVDDPVFIALADVIKTYRLPMKLFHDLLSAFRQDVTKKRYSNFGEVMEYCRRSANPVGRLLLHLSGHDSDNNLAYSDAICSALQLINFWQDIKQDYDENDRIYLPLDEMQRFGVSEIHLAERINDFAMQQLMQFQVERSRKLLQAGAPLGKRLHGRFGFEIRLTIAGGTRVLQKLFQQKNDAFSRPRLNKADYLWMAWHALRAR